MDVFFAKCAAETANQPGKTATIEMYAPSSYNDTVTGETLSSVSEKSESYSNDGSQGDYIVSTIIYILLYIRFLFPAHFFVMKTIVFLFKNYFINKSITIL